MNDNKHVYCTQCKNFRLSDEEIPYCVYEDKCDIHNCEDSMLYMYRKFYESKSESEIIRGKRSELPIIYDEIDYAEDKAKKLLEQYFNNTSK